MAERSPLEGSGSRPHPSAADDRIPRPKHSLALSSGAVFAISLSVQLIGFIGSTVFLARHVGITDSGKALIGLAQLFLLIASSINGLGDLRIGTAYTYFLARGKSPTDNTGTYLLFRAAMVALAGLVLFVIAPYAIGGENFAPSSSNLAMFGVFLTLPLLWSFSTVYNQMHIGLGDAVKAQSPTLVEGVARLPVLIYATFYAPNLEAITAAYVVGALASALYSLPAVSRQLRRARREEILGLFRFAWPLMASLFLNYVVTNLIPFFVAGQGTALLNIFLITNGFRILLLSVATAITVPFFPYIAGLHQRREYERIRQGTWQALRYAAMLLVPGIVALVTYRSNFLNVLTNATYVGPGSLVLAVLVAGSLPLAFSQIMQSSINAIGRQRLELYITSTQFGTLLLATVLFVPPYAIFPVFNSFIPASQEPGLVAAAATVLLSSVAAMGLNTYFMEKLTRVHIQPWPILGITLSAAGSFTALSIVNRTKLFPVSSSYQLVAAVLIGFTVYLLILAGIGELTRTDVRSIGQSLGVPRPLYDTIARLCWREDHPGLPPVDLSRAAGLRPTELPETFTGTTEGPELGQVSGESADRENGRLKD